VETLSFANADITKDRPRSLMVRPLPLSIDVMNACEAEVLQDLAKHQFPAYYWSDQYQHLINKKPETALELKKFF